MLILPSLGENSLHELGNRVDHAQPECILCSDTATENQALKDRIHSETVRSFLFAASVNCSASAFVNRMGTILPLASPLGTFVLPGLRFTRPAPLLLYYNNYRVVKYLWSRAGKSNPVTAIGALLKGSKTLWPCCESSVPPRDVPSAVSGLPEGARSQEN